MKLVQRLDGGQQDEKNEDKNLPVIVGALDTIKKELDQNLQWLPGHPLAMQLLKITRMSTSHIIRSVPG
jgi:uncharacterized FlaG/YvyC family protein